MKFISTVIFVFLVIESFTQEVKENNLFHDLSIDYGIFASLNSEAYENLAGNRLNIQSTYYLFNDMGIRTGISFINNLEGCNKFYSIPLQFVYRTPVYKSSEIYIDAESITDFVFQLIIGLMPKQFEFNVGANIGYIDPNNNLSLVSIDNGPWFEEGFSTEKRFVSTIDIGFRGKYKIRRFGILLSPTMNYLLTKNFKYNSEMNLDREYKPQLFISFTFGLSYEF